MFKNNFKALLVHVVLSFFSIVAYIAFFTSQYKWNNEAAYRRHELILTAIALAIVIIVLTLYYLSGRLFFKSSGNNLKNMISVSSVAAVGIVWWCSNSLFIQARILLLNYISWFYYCLYNSYGFPLIQVMKFDNAFIYLIFSLLPSIFMGIGLVEKELSMRKSAKCKEEIEKELAKDNKLDEIVKANYEKEEKSSIGEISESNVDEQSEETSEIKKRIRIKKQKNRNEK